MQEICTSSLEVHPSPPLTKKPHEQKAAECEFPFLGEFPEGRQHVTWTAICSCPTTQLSPSLLPYERLRVEPTQIPFHLSQINSIGGPRLRHT